MHLDSFLVRVLIPFAPIVGLFCFLFFFLSPGALAMYLREGFARYVIPCSVLVVVTITSFLSSLKRLELLLFDEGKEFSCSHVEEHWVSVHSWGGRSPSTNRVADCHSVEEFGFQLLKGRDVTLLQGGAV
jgi:hypothetical protein